MKGRTSIPAAKPAPPPEDCLLRSWKIGHIVSEFALSLEQPQMLLVDWLTVKYYELPIDYWDRYAEQVAKVTPEKIQEVAKKYVDLDHVQIVCVGDAKQIEGVLEKYGPVEITDADGKPVKLQASAASVSERQ